MSDAAPSTEHGNVAHTPEALAAFERLDSLSATLASLAQSSGRLSPGGVDSAVPWDQHTADEFYRANEYAAIICDALPEDATRKGFDVTVSEAEDDDDGDADSHPFDEELKRLGLLQKLAQADALARKDGSAAIYIGTSGGGAPSQPLNPDGVRRVTHLTVVEGWHMQPDTWQANFLLPHFGEPLTYRIQPQVSGGGYTSQIIVHRSRLLILDGRWVPERIRADNSYYMADSVLQLAWRRVQDLARADKDIGIILRSFSQATLKIAGLAQLFASGNCEAVSARLALTNAGLNALGMTVLDAEGNESLDYATRTVAGLADLYDRIAQSVATAARMPKTRLFGAAPGGLSTDDASGTRAWDDQVQTHQTNDLQPHVERVVTLVSKSRLGPTDGELVDFYVSWKPLRQMTEKEEAEIRKAQADTDNIYWQMGVLSDEEIRESRFGGTTYSTETTLQDDADLDDVDPSEAEVSGGAE